MPSAAASHRSSGAILMATRRITSGPTSHGYVADTLTRLLCASGVDRNEARGLAAQAASDHAPVLADY